MMDKKTAHTIMFDKEWDRYVVKFMTHNGLVLKIDVSKSEYLHNKDKFDAVVWIKLQAVVSRMFHEDIPEVTGKLSEIFNEQE